MHLYYDEEGDFLEISIGKHTEGYFRNLGKGIFERVDKKTKEVKGVAVMGFKKRTQRLKDTSVSLPFTIELTS